VRPDGLRTISAILQTYAGRMVANLRSRQDMGMTDVIIVMVVTV
jgi:hypothetical protein